MAHHGAGRAWSAPKLSAIAGPAAAAATEPGETDPRATTRPRDVITAMITRAGHDALIGPKSGAATNPAG